MNEELYPNWLIDPIIWFLAKLGVLRVTKKPQAKQSIPRPDFSVSNQHFDYRPPEYGPTALSEPQAATGPVGPGYQDYAWNSCCICKAPLSMLMFDTYDSIEVGGLQKKICPRCISLIKRHPKP
jgi:hypothetical protein